MKKSEEQRTPRPRGRPRNDANPKTREADATIAKTVWQLLAWGYPLRSGVAETVGQLARSELNRPSSEGGDLGPDQIENIFERWFKDQQEGSEGGFPLDRPWNRYQVDWLRGSGPQYPRLTHREIAKILMQNRGEWPNPEELPGYIPEHGDMGYVRGDPQLTKKAHEEYLRNRLRWADSPFKRGN